jgi:hypothetical protein
MQIGVARASSSGCRVARLSRAEATGGPIGVLNRNALTRCPADIAGVCRGIWARPPGEREPQKALETLQSATQAEGVLAGKVVIVLRAIVKRR